MSGDLGLSRDVLSLFERQFPYGLVLLDNAFSVRWLSTGFTTLLGYRSEELLGSNLVDLVHPADLDLLLPMASQMVDVAPETLRAPTVSGTIELAARLQSADGRWLPVAVSGRMFDREGSLVLCLRFAADRHALDAVLDCLARGADADETASRLVDLISAQFAGASTWLVHDQGGAPAVVGPTPNPGCGDPESMMRRLREAGPKAEVECVDRRWLVPVLSATRESLVGVFVLDGSSLGLPNPYDRHVLSRAVGLASLAFAKGDAEQSLRRAATTDPLTGLYNRREMESRTFRLAVDPDNFPVSLLYVDIDRFKSINDRHGHEAGDLVLTVVARRLREGVRASDSVGRLGGDEFAILCPTLADVALEEMRERLASAVAAPIELDVFGSTISVTASIGSASAMNDDDLADLVARSDGSMYARKRQSRSAERN